jgi:hypothetical protein
MSITSQLLKILHGNVTMPLAGFRRASDGAQKLDVAVSEIVDLTIAGFDSEAALNDYFGEVALGNIAGRKSVNKFGAAPSGVQILETDIWDRADAAVTQRVWLAPTAARIHTIASTSAQDDVGGTGVSTVDVYYLPDWDTAEAVERVSGNLNGGIAMTNAAVIIHRIECVPQATTTAGVNAGTITATAAAPDNTITAAVLPGNGQTEMAIYGIPSIQSLLVYNWMGQVDKSQGATSTIDFLLRVNPNPNVQTLAFLRKDDITVQSTGTSSNQKDKKPPICIAGPAIIKVTGQGSVNDLDAEASFDLIVADN